MRVLMLSKALVVGQYQTKAQLLANKPGIELTVVVPPAWRDERGVLALEQKHTNGYQLIVAPICWNGNYHLHFYPTIGSILSRAQPDLIHLDEEPYNLATFHALFQARRRIPNARILFFTWQNLQHTYPLPFSLMETYVYKHSHYALAGNQTASQVLRAKGFAETIRVVPQFGVEPTIYTPLPAPRSSDKFVIGFAGRLVPEKGASLLLSALLHLSGNWELQIVGSGPERAQLEHLAQQLNIAPRVNFLTWQSSAQMPDFYRGLDVLVAPSLSRPNWIEQFGRVLIEAMSCGIPVVGSTCGEIPNVIGEAGIIFPEGNTNELASALRTLMNDSAQRASFGQYGRTRVLEKFTQQRVVDETFAAYNELVR